MKALGKFVETALRFAVVESLLPKRTLQLGCPTVEEFDGTHLVFVRAGSDPYEVITNFVNVAAETNLNEWTARTKFYDRCHEPALLHASVARNRKLIMDWIPAGDLEDVTYKEDPEAYKAAWSLLKGANRVLVPRGFGDRGVQGKILVAAKYTREHN
ncbi:hypothetical protein Fmac_012068 [Flemingia macrophylla]|uniref:Uncharacterized protein n=1 Tax=Flemingia macrophylla TaxID=520843 RepID=A0ABD1MQ37_9FABA